MDPSEQMRARAQRHVTAAGVHARVHIVPGSAVDLPFDDGAFDGVISHYALHHVDRPEEMLNESARVTRHGGRVVIKDLLRPSRTLAALQKAFVKHVGNYNESQQTQYRESIEAALTLAELRGALRRSKLAHAEIRRVLGLEWLVVAGVGDASR